MLDRFTREDLENLLTHEAKHFVSIYMPAHRIHNGSDEDRIRLKNQLDEIEDRLSKRGLEHQNTRSLLRPATELLDNEDFWQNQEDGLAIFLSDQEEFAQTFRLPLRFTESVTVADQFLVRPLLQLLATDSLFFILALSQNAVRLYRGNRYSLEQMEVDSLPANMDEALWMDDPERNLQFHTQTGTAANSGQRRAQFHGHAPDEDREQADLLRYCRTVDEAVSQTLHNNQEPLLLASVKELYPVYATANTYTNLDRRIIEGNPDRVNSQELHAHAWEILQPQMNQRRLEAVQQFRDLSNDERSVAGLEDVIRTAFQARVDSLFVEEQAHQWGTFDSETGTIEQSNNGEPAKTDLVERAVLLTISNGGQVWVLPAEQMPVHNSPVAAILRF